MRALLSVYDKAGVVEFAGALSELGWELVSSGGTYAAIAGAGIPVISVEDPRRNLVQPSGAQTP